MVDIKNFRRINEIEKEIITNSLRNISPKLLSVFKDFENDLFLLLDESTLKIIYPKIFFISDSLKNILRNTNLKGNIYSIGLYFGSIKKGNFLISLEGVEFLYKEDIFSDFHHILVNKRGEKSILYGNDILKSMISGTHSRFNKDDFLLIFNDDGEIIAIARSKVEHDKLQNLKSNELIALNLVDKGYYLRKKQ